MARFGIVYEIPYVATNYYLSDSEVLWEWIHTDHFAGDTLRDGVGQLPAPAGYIFRIDDLYEENEPVEEPIASYPMYKSLEVPKSINQRELVQWATFSMRQVDQSAFNAEGLNEDRIIRVAETW